MLLTSTLAQLARKRPTDVALADVECTFSWSQLEARVARAAGYLLGKGLRRGERIGLALSDDAEFVVVLLAALQIGLVVAPIDWRCKPQERNTMLTGFALRALVVRPTAAEDQPGHISWQMPEHQAPVTTVEPAAPDEPCMIMLSSGTTGAPSGAVLTCRSLEHRLTAGGDAAFTLAGHRYLSFLPLCFASGISQVLRNLAAGNPVIIHPTLFTAKELIAAVKRYAPTYIGIVPATLRSLLRLTDAELAGLSELSVIRLGGSGMTLEERLQSAQRIGVPIYHSYGTSAFGPICHWSSADLQTPPDSVGKPYTWVELRIVDQDGKEQGPQQVGMLECRGPPLASELLSIDGKITSLRGCWYAPGDLAQLDAEGNLFIVGRGSDVIIRAGVNVYPELVERVLLSHPAVQDAAVVGRPLSGAEEEVAAFVVLRTQVAVVELLAYCRVHISSKYRPDEIHLVAELPRTASGKVQRQVLRRSLTAGGTGCARGGLVVGESSDRI